MIKLTPELIEQLDKVSPSPQLLAAEAFALFQQRCPELTNQQLQCFAIEYLASQVATGELGFAEKEVKALASLYYFAHYYRVSCQPQTSTLKTESFNQDLTKKVD